MFIICSIIGIAIGVGAAIAVTYFAVMASNVSGDSKGELNDFSKSPILVLEKQNKVSKDMPL